MERTATLIAREYIEAYCLNKDDLFHVFKEHEVELHQLTFNVIDHAIAQYGFGDSENGAQSPYYEILTRAKETTRAKLDEERKLASLLAKKDDETVIALITNSLAQATKALPSPRPASKAPRSPKALASHPPRKIAPEHSALPVDESIASAPTSQDENDAGKCNDKGYSAVKSDVGVRRASIAGVGGRRESIGGPQRFVMPARVTASSKNAPARSHTHTAQSNTQAALSLDADSPAAHHAPLLLHTFDVNLRIPVTKAATGNSNSMAAGASSSRVRARPSPWKREEARSMGVLASASNTSCATGPGSASSPKISYRAQSLSQPDQPPMPIEMQLRSLRFFAPFECEFIEAFAAHLVWNAFRAREIVFSEGSFADTVVIINRGQLEFLFQLMPVPIVAGDCCGDFEFFMSISRRVGMLVTREPSEIYSVDVANLADLLEHYPEHAEALRHSAEARMAAWERSSNVLLSQNSDGAEGSDASRHASSLEQRLVLAEARTLDILSALEQLLMSRAAPGSLQPQPSPALHSVDEENEGDC